MSTTEAELVIEVWSVFKENVNARVKQDLLEQMLKVFEDAGMDPSEMDDLRGQDSFIDTALKNLYDIDEDDDEEDEDDY